MAEKNTNETQRTTERKKSNGGKVGGATAAIVAVALLLFGSNGGFGLFDGGRGTGDASGTGTVSQAEGTSESQNAQSIIESMTETSVPEQTTGVVNVTIKQDKVTVNGEACDTPEALKAMVEKLYADDRTFELHEDQSILATHEWVLKVFEELKITLVPVQE